MLMCAATRGETGRDGRIRVQNNVSGIRAVGNNRADGSEKRSAPERFGINGISPVKSEILNHDPLAVVDVDASGWSREIQRGPIAIKDKILNVVDLQVGPVIEDVIQRSWLVLGQNKMVDTVWRKPDDIAVSFNAARG